MSSVSNNQGLRIGFPYTGIVEDNNDLKGAERCQIRIAGLNDGIKREDLPWYGNAQNSRMCGGQAASGSSYIPEKGSKVRVVFYSQDFYDAEYFPYPKTPDTAIPEAKIAYPDTPVIFRFPDGTVAFYNKPTQELCIRSAGSCKLRIQGDTNIRSVSGNINLECQAYSSHGKSSVDVYSPTVTVHTGGFAVVPYSAPPPPDTGPDA